MQTHTAPPPGVLLSQVPGVANDGTADDFEEFWEYVSRVIGAITGAVDIGNGDVKTYWARRWLTSRQGSQVPPQPAFKPRIELLTKFYRPTEAAVDSRTGLTFGQLAPTNGPRVEGKLSGGSTSNTSLPPAQPTRHLGRPTSSTPPRLQTLCPEEERFVDAALRHDAFVAKVAREQVVAADIRRLKPNVWINDEVINFYGALIMARGERNRNEVGASKRKEILDVFVLSSFFWEKLDKEGYENGNLDRWSKRANVDIFQKDLIILPINHAREHWSVCAINFRKKRFESYDSMGVAKDHVLSKLRKYVAAEHRVRKNRGFDFTGWSDHAPDDIPQQGNHFDCGVFTCQYMEALARGLDSFSFSQVDMPGIRRRMIWEIGHSELTADRSSAF